MDAFEQAVAAHRAGDLATAEQVYAAFRDHPRALHNLGVIYGATGRFSQAEAAFRRALQLEPTNGPSAYSLAMQLLAQGRYAEAWPLHEGRRRQPGLYIPKLEGLPEWKGEDLTGQRIIVVGEQGFGDQIQFSRLIPKVAAAEVTYLCSPSVARLFEGCPFKVARGAKNETVPEADYWVLLMSLPWRLGLTLENLPPPLALPAIRRTGGGGIGVAVKGRPAHPNDANRSLSPEAAEAVRALGRELAPDVTGARDFRDTAEIIAGLDLVISVDTSVAHLAATLGVPTWVLLPARGADWRWLRDRTDSPWYPSVRLFRQPRHGDWRAVLDEVQAALAAR